MAASPEPYENHLEEPPPQSAEDLAEQTLLGALLLEPHRLRTLHDLEAGHFADYAHSALFAAMQAVPAPDPEQHRRDPAWLNTVLAQAQPEARGLNASYLHTLIRVCPWPQHARTYAQMVHAEHARRTLPGHADRLTQIATDTSLPDPAAAVLAQADALSRYLDDITAQFAPHPGSLPRTQVPPAPPPDTGEEALDEERLFLATATAQPDELKALRWLQAEDFAVPVHGQLYLCLTVLAHRGEEIDPVTVLWEAQHRGLLNDPGVRPEEVLALTSQPAGSPEYWAEQILQRALLFGTHRTAARIRAFAEDPANSPHQLITGARRALADLTALRARLQPCPPTRVPKPTTPPVRPPAPSARGTPALHTSRGAAALTISAHFGVAR